MSVLLSGEAAESSDYTLTSRTQYKATQHRSGQSVISIEEPASEVNSVNSVYQFSLKLQSLSQKQRTRLRQQIFSDQLFPPDAAVHCGRLTPGELGKCFTY